MKTFQESVEFRRSVRVFKPIDIDSEIVKKCIENAIISPNSSNMQLTQYIHVTSKELLSKIVPICLGQSAAKTANQLVIIIVKKTLAKERAKQNYESITSQKNTGYKYHQNGYKLALQYYSKLMPFFYSKDIFGILGKIKYLIVSAIGIFRPMVRQVSNSDIRITMHKTAGIAAQTFMLSMAANGYDTCPMEGLDSLRLKKLLKLPSSCEINMAIACGIREKTGVFGEQFRVPFEEVYTKL